MYYQPQWAAAGSIFCSAAWVFEQVLKGNGVFNTASEGCLKGIAKAFV
jgi:hypothetical protein